jgi:hypothetical protein
MTIKENPLETRDDVISALLGLVAPLKSHFSPKGARLVVGASGVHYANVSAEMEGFSRPLWGLAPLWKHEKETEFLEIYQSGLANGTNPESGEYWGKVFDFDQKIVEMAAISSGISMVPEKLWDCFSDPEKQRIYSWLDQVNSYEFPRNNWRFFRVLVNLMFWKQGLPYNKEKLASDLADIESYYSGDGWYFDGVETHIDYYISFAMHYYGLLCTHLFGEEVVPASEYLKRAEQFAPDFLHWFSKDGVALPFGRSLTYRFAQGSFFSAFALAGGKSLSPGVVKGALLRNMRWWLSRPIFDNSGILTIGYGYPNLIMSEHYNAPGSPYWSMKAFASLALPKEHEFWTAKEEPFEPEQKKVLPHARMVIERDKANVNVVAYPAGQCCHEMGNIIAKYEKFAYSTVFGFSISRGNTLPEGAFDSTLAISAKGDNFYRPKQGFSDFSVKEDGIFVSYAYPGLADVKTLIIPLHPWHVRVHAITAHQAIDLADSGFAILAEKESQLPDEDSYIGDNFVLARYPWATSGIYLEHGTGSFELIKAFPNTNVLSPTTKIPTAKVTLEPGKAVIATSVIGCPGTADLSKRPVVKIDGDKVEVTYENKTLSFALSHEKR